MESVHREELPAFRVPPSLIAIPASSFAMGSDEADNERPIHRVSVGAFLIGAFQVTNAEYSRFIRSTSDSDLPVCSVSWFDAVAYCDWLSGVSGRRFRLPTEAEWECAARGGAEQLRYPWGDDPPESRPDDHRRWLHGPEPVGRGAPNAFGLYDICENVHEWCSDWYDAGYYAVSPEHDPRGPESGTRRASRGGSWRHQVKVSRCAARSSIPPTFRYPDYGFRVVTDFSA